MKPVAQSRNTGDDGNCFEASLASILEVELEEVPPYTEGNARMQDYFEARLDSWLAARGLALVAVNVFDKVDDDGRPDRLPDHLPPDVQWIAAIELEPGSDYHHAAVMRGRELAHDPAGEFGSTAEFEDRIASAMFLLPLS